MSKVYFREALLERDADGVANGISKLSFASELPVLRKDKKGKRYYEVLSHSPGDANLGQLNREGVVLQDHDDKNEIGEVVKDSAKVDADRKTRANIRLHDGAWLTRAKSEPLNIPVSVGYTQLSMLRELESPDGIPIRIFSWSPYEISLLTVEPADDTVGLNRAKVKRQCPECEGHGRCRCRKADDDEADAECEHCDGDGDCADCGGTGYFESARSKEVDSRKKTERKKEKIMPEIIEADIRKNERETVAANLKNRTKEIVAIADGFITQSGTRKLADGTIVAEKIRKLANEALQDDAQTPDVFRWKCQSEINSSQEVVMARDFASDDEMAEFSLLRAIQSAAKSRMKGDAPFPDEKEAEGELIKEYRSRLEKSEGGMGFVPSGFIVPPDAQFGSSLLSRAEMKSQKRKMRNKFGRDMQATVFGAGGATVPTYWMLPYIEFLYNQIVLARLGMRTMAGLTGNVVIPRLDAPCTPYSVSEIQALNASQETLGQISLKPNRVGITINYSKQWVFQSSPDAEALVRDDAMEMLGIKWDLLGLFGQGANNEPTGIFNTPGIGSLVFGATPTYKQIVQMETGIRDQNVKGPLSYSSSSLTKGSLKTVAEALTGATTIGGAANAIWKSIGQDMGEEGRVNGWPALDSQQFASNQVLCAAMAKLIHGIFGGLDIVVDYYTKAVNAEIALTFNTWGDYAVRHPQAFYVSADAGNQ